MKIGNMLGASRAKNAIPRGARQMVQRCLLWCGLYDNRPVRLGLNDVYDDDIFIASYPKSGNTWVRFLIANLQNPDTEITFRNINTFVPGMRWSRDLINSMKTRPRLIKTHQPMFDCFPRCVYVVRDARDVMVSYWHYAGKPLQLSFEQFVRDYVPEKAGGSWALHVGGALAKSEQDPARMLFLRYEDLLADPRTQALRISDFCRLHVTGREVENAVERSSFQSLRANEAKFGSEREGNSAPFFRSGRSGVWQDVFTKDLLDEFMKESAPVLMKCGYEV